MNRTFLNFNPEIQRYFWQDFTPSKILLMPLILGLIYLLALTSASLLSHTSLFLYLIVTILWGSKHASESIPNEVLDQTWDWQRMSALTPWQMTIGKLFGSTLYAWYGGVITLMVFFMSSMASQPFWDTIRMLVLAILSAIGTHGVSVLFSLYGNQKEKKRNKFQAWIFIFFITSMFFGGFISFYILGGSFQLASPEVSFFGIQMDLLSLVLLQTLHLDAWIVFGIYRLMRTEQFYFNSPYAWLIFLLEVPFFASGILVNIPNLSLSIYLLIYFYMVTCLAGVFIYLPALGDSIQVINIRRLFNKIKEKDYEKAGYDFPIWGTSFIVMFIFALLTFLTLIIIQDGDLQNFIKHEKIKNQLLMIILSITFFILRDLGILLYNAFSDSKKGQSKTILYLFILYYLMPAIVVTSDAKPLLSLFSPFNPESNYNSDEIITIMNVIFPLIEAAAVWIGLYFYWNKLNQRVEQSIL